MWKEIAKRKTPKGNDNIYLASYGGWYSVRDEAFWSEDELVTGADGKKTAPTGAPVEWVEEPSYFFRLVRMGVIGSSNSTKRTPTSSPRPAAATR